MKIDNIEGLLKAHTKLTNNTFEYYKRVDIKNIVVANDEVHYVIEYGDGYTYRDDCVIEFTKLVLWYINARMETADSDKAELVEALKSQVEDTLFLAKFHDDTLRSNISSTDSEPPEYYDWQSTVENMELLEKHK